ncbi:hypothetical protein OXX79_013241 [Metschnikowia pulcherrima]
MRNLVLLNKGQILPESRTYPDLVPVDAVFDAVSDTVTVVLSSAESGVVEVQNFMKTGMYRYWRHFSPSASFFCLHTLVIRRFLCLFSPMETLSSHSTTL